MPGVKGIKQGARLHATHFAEDDPVRSPAESRLQKVVERDVRLERVRLAFDRQNVRLLDVKLGSILDDDNALLFWDEIRQYPQKSGLAGAGSTTDKQGLTTANLLR